MAAPASQAQVLREATELIRNRMPPGWKVEPSRMGDRGNATVDARFTVSAPDGRQVDVVVEVKSGAPAGREARGLAHALHERAVAENAIPMLFARYLAPQVRDELGRIGVSFADTTGNLELSAVDPGIYVSDRGEDRDPARSPGRPRGTLKGEPAALVVRTLLDFSRRWTARELVAESGASTGATYRVLEHLDREGLADRVDGRWSIPSWERLLRAWAEDYDLLSVNDVSRYLDPRGIEHFEGVIREDPGLYAVTGAAASRAWTSIAPVRAIFVYVDDADASAKRWGVRPTDSGANIVLCEPRSKKRVVFERLGTLGNGIRRVAPTQVAVDLLNGPGRDAQEAEELIRWMRVNETEWRLA